jgi:hypothetical protein
MDEEWQRRHDVMHEALDSKLDAILEMVSVIPAMNDRLGRVENRLDRLEGRLTSVEVILEEHSKTLGEHSKILDEQSGTLGGHSAILSGHSADLKEIKQIVVGNAEAIVELRAASHTH